MLTYSLIFSVLSFYDDIYICFFPSTATKINKSMLEYKRLQASKFIPFFSFFSFFSFF